MSNTDINNINTDSTESLDLTESTNNLNKLYPTNRNLQTDASQGFYDRFVTLSKNLYQNQGLLNKDQYILLFGALLGGYLTMSNLSPEYRFDKSPTISLVNDNNSWQNLRDDIYFSEFSINDQPNYSHNDTIILAQKIGFPTEFEL